MVDGNSGPKICVAVLAAGSARRFGGGKLDAKCAGRPVGQWVIDTVQEAGLEAGLCITGPQPPSFAQRAKGWHLVTNLEPSAGLGSSLALAAERAGEMGADSLLVLLADMPLVSADFLADLARQKTPAGTDYGSERIGVPALFPARLFGQLQGLTGDRGAALLLSSLPDCKRLKPFAEMLMDVDIASDITLVEEALLARRS